VASSFEYQRKPEASLLKVEVTVHGTLFSLPLQLVTVPSHVILTKLLIRSTLYHVHVKCVSPLHKSVTKTHWNFQRWDHWKLGDPFCL